MGTEAIDAERFGAAIGELIREITEPVEERIKQLEGRIEGMQKTLDRSKTKMVYAGEWQSVLDYAPGAVVRHAGALYTTSRPLKPGNSIREGGGWERLT